MTEIDPDYTRVTEVFKPYTNFDSIDPLVLQRAAERGTKVHRYAQLYAEGMYFPEPDEEIKGFVGSYCDWFDEMVEKVLFVEQRIYNKQYMVTGAIDLVCAIRGSDVPVIIDLKTPATESKTWCLQLAMYKLLYDSELGEGLKTSRRIALMLKKNGSVAKVCEYTEHSRDLEIYLGILAAHRYFN